MQRFSDCAACCLSTQCPDRCCLSYQLRCIQTGPAWSIAICHFIAWQAETKVGRITSFIVLSVHIGCQLSFHMTCIIKYPYKNKVVRDLNIPVWATGFSSSSWTDRQTFHFACQTLLLRCSTHLQQTTSSLLVPFMSLVFCGPELLQQTFCQSLHCAPFDFKGLTITNHLERATKGILLKMN